MLIVILHEIRLLPFENNMFIAILHEKGLIIFLSADCLLPFYTK